MSIEEQIKVEVADFVYSSVPFGPFVMHLKVPDRLVAAITGPAVGRLQEIALTLYTEQRTSTTTALKV